MAIDLKDAYYCVRVNPNFQKYFTCYWQECYYEFLRMPNGYAQAPLLFTKLLKQPFGFLRKHGYASVVHIDDTYLQGDTYKHCLENIHATRDLLVSLGVSINYVKSVFQPANMSISLTDKRKSVLLNACHNLASVDRHKIRTVASAVGCIIAALPGVKYGGLFYRNLERCKIIALKYAKGDYEKTMTLSPQAKRDLHWWSHHLPFASHFIHTPAVSLTLFSDAS